MDVIELRRGLLAQMASGARFAKGTFTTDSASVYTIQFGKTFSKYLYYIEMTDESKTALMNSGATSAKMFVCYGIYPKIAFDNSHESGDYYMSTRIAPSTGDVSVSSTAMVQAIDNTSITFGNAAIAGGSNSLYRGYSYNYYIVEIK